MFYQYWEQAVNRIREVQCDWYSDKKHAIESWVCDEMIMRIENNTDSTMDSYDIVNQFVKELEVPDDPLEYIAPQMKDTFMAMSDAANWILDNL